MSFKFSWFCELLDDLENARLSHGRVTKQDNFSQRIVRAWFLKHEAKIIRRGPSASALLSALLPERRVDRVYNLQQKRLSAIFGRALGLGQARNAELRRWESKDGNDFATCVGNIMADAENNPTTPKSALTLEEVDAALHQIAANSPFANPAMKARSNSFSADEILKKIILKLQSREGKWFVKMILKSYAPVEIPEYTALHSFHFALPILLQIQNSFEVALECLNGPELKNVPARISEDHEKAILSILIRAVMPQLGVMIKRQAFFKARSIKHCVKMCMSRTMSVERKYDGEYCQIHIDATRQHDRIQIYSKSGKDSTRDRWALHKPIEIGLQLGKDDCKIKRNAILEGELVVWSRNQQKVLPFYHVRKHVLHAGRKIGCDRDSPIKPDEQLMIYFFDVLMLDDGNLLSEPHERRRAILKKLITLQAGVSMCVERVMIDFSRSDAPALLRECFSRAIRWRWEGLVLKGIKDPFFSWSGEHFSIKLKKDYITGLGDVADLCIVAGHRQPGTELEIGKGPLVFTHFHLAALTNKEDVVRYSAVPAFRMLDVLSLGSLSKKDVMVLNREALAIGTQSFTSHLVHIDLEFVRSDTKVPDSVFNDPIIIEVTGAGYDRPQTTDFWVLRFPRKTGSCIKIHRDRSVTDTHSFDEIQEMAEKAMNDPVDTDSQEDARWIEGLERADPPLKHVVQRSQETSPRKSLHSLSIASISPVRAVHHLSSQPIPTTPSSSTILRQFLHGNDSRSPRKTPEILETSSCSGGDHRDKDSLTGSPTKPNTTAKRDFAYLTSSPTKPQSGKRSRRSPPGTVISGEDRAMFGATNVTEKREPSQVRLQQTDAKTIYHKARALRRGQSEASAFCTLPKAPIDTFPTPKLLPAAELVMPTSPMSGNGREKVDNAIYWSSRQSVTGSRAALERSTSTSTEIQVYTSAYSHSQPVTRLEFKTANQAQDNLPCADVLTTTREVFFLPPSACVNTGVQHEIIDSLQHCNAAVVFSDVHFTDFVREALASPAGRAKHQCAVLIDPDVLDSTSQAIDDLCKQIAAEHNKGRAKASTPQSRNEGIGSVTIPAFSYRVLGNLIDGSVSELMSAPINHMADLCGTVSFRLGDNKVNVVSHWYDSAITDRDLDKGRTYI